MTTNKLRLTTCGHLPHFSKGLCKSCYQRAWREANAERVMAYEKTWHAANPEKRRRYVKAWQAANHTTAHSSWQAVLQRCRNPKNQRWFNYGGAGVAVCDRWNPQAGGSFTNFLADMGERPEGTTLGRFGDVGNYEPGNCAWQTWPEQRAEQRKKRNRVPAEAGR